MSELEWAVEEYNERISEIEQERYLIKQAKQFEQENQALHKAIDNLKQVNEQAIDKCEELEQSKGELMFINNTLKHRMALLEKQLKHRPKE